MLTIVGISLLLASLNQETQACQSEAPARNAQYFFPCFERWSKMVVCKPYRFPGDDCGSSLNYTLGAARYKTSAQCLANTPRVKTCFPRCENGGMCDADAQVCECANGHYTGDHCEIPTFSCTDNDCGHGECVPPGVCKCHGQVGEYGGATCQNDCSSNRCRNGGTCSDDNVCTCINNQSFGGDQCEYLCSPMCVHGICTGNNQCKCDPSWKGPTCNETSIDTNQCLLYLPFNDDVKDHSAYEHTVEQTGGQLTKTMIARGTGSLNVSNTGFVEVPSMARLDLNLEATFCLFFKPDSELSEGELMSNTDDSNGDYSVKIMAKRGKKFQFFLRTTANITYDSGEYDIYEDWIGSPFDPTVPTGFNLICMGFDGTYVLLWQNRGVITGTRFYGRLAVSNAPYRIGKGFTGIIDEVLVCRRSFSNYDVGAVWNGRRSLELRGFLPLSSEAKDDKLYLKVQPQRSPNGCGHTQTWTPSNPRIVGGFNVEPEELPFQVYLDIAIGFESFSCGGSVIGNRWILTAAHCVTSNDGYLSIADEVLIYFGLYSYGQREGYLTRIVANQSQIHVHPDYDEGFLGKPRGYTDFALIYLEDPIEYNEFIQPICLPESCADTALCAANETVLISGYGITTDRTDLFPYELLKAYVQILSDEECRAMANASGISHWDTEAHRLLCSWSMPSNDIATCRGDSGGPLACYKAGYFIVQGVTSRVWSCAEPGVPNYFGDVCEVRDWIEEITGL